MRFITRVLNPFHKQEQRLKEARDREIKRLKEEGKSDDEIIFSLMSMPETKEFIEQALKSNPVKGKDNYFKAQMVAKLTEGFTKTVKEWT